jgi:hypothetical protein
MRILAKYFWWIAGVLFITSLVLAHNIGYFRGANKATVQTIANIQLLESMLNECYDDMNQACASENWPSVISRHGGMNMPWCEGYGTYGLEPAHEPSAEYIKGMVAHAAWALEQERVPHEQR